MIAIITYSNYPKGSAGAVRYATFAHTYADLGYKVVVLQKLSDCDDGKIKVENLYSSNRYSQYYLFGYRVVTSLKRLRREENIDGVIIGADVPAIHVITIKWWCRFNRIPCIFDATEWYSKEQFVNWRTSIPYWERELLNRFIIDNKSRVIAISSYLYDYFRSKGCKVTQIPIIYNQSAHDQLLARINSSGLLRIIYAGSHLKMDNIPLIIEALSILSEEERAKIRFVVYGLRKEQIENSVSRDVLDTVQDSLLIMGRRPNCEVLDAYSQVDFSIVLRDPSLRVNKAGFPSKVVESMRLGVPVICNYSSDLGDYLVHNNNSIIVESLNVVDLSRRLQELLQMPQSDREEIGKMARQTISERLDSKRFEDKFRYIIS